MFVHGLQGHPKRTWLAAANTFKPPLKQRIGIQRHRATTVNEAQSPGYRDVFWPQELLPQDCPDARILTFGYDSAVTKFFGGAANQNNIFANSLNLLYSLNRLRANSVTISGPDLLYSLSDLNLARPATDFCCPFSWG